MPGWVDEPEDSDGVPLAWRRCLARLEEELTSRQFNTFIRPLQVRLEGTKLVVLAPNDHVKKQVRDEYLPLVWDLFDLDEHTDIQELELTVGTRERSVGTPLRVERTRKGSRDTREPNLDRSHVFANYVEGKSNEVAKAAAHRVATNVGRSYNPLCLYGGVGLGKTHLMHAVGNEVLENTPEANVVYLHSQQFVNDMVRGIGSGTIRQTMQYYRSMDVLLIDDIQFFANKLRSQEEFFHVFNAVVEQNHQMVLTCDKYPTEIDGLEERLKSRFVGGLTTEVEPPELETRVAILKKKGEAEGIEVPDDVAFHIAENIRSNVRELEGALQRVIAHAQFRRSEVSIDLVKRALHDLLAIHGRQVTVENIQKVVADYFNMKVSDLLSKRRNRTVARPRQIAMCLAKEFTRNSLPDIGEKFGGRDHTTVLHAYRRINALRESSTDIAEDYKILSRLLTN
ncbi:MAG: chromosomal replication initiator protein DnaA [Gammaproteobacteria bacterium]|nr:chromosomal replication initiator protein DnaA [Gammaproteobacteria bacterium]